MRLAWLVLLAGCAPATSPAPGVGPPRKPPVDHPLAPVEVPVRACFTRAEAAPWEQKIEAWNQASFERALADQGLVVTRLEDRTVTYDLHGPGAGQEGQVVQRGGVQLITGPMGATCPQPGQWVLVRDRAGDLWAVERAPHAVSRPSLALCGCNDFVGYYQCGGAMPLPVQRFYVLPAGVTWRGKKSLAYDVIEPATGFQGGDACPPPPPPPP